MTVVISVPLSAKTFTQEDLEVSKKYICPDVYPGLYNQDELPPGTTFIDRRIVPINSFMLQPKEIDDKKDAAKLFMFQDARFTSRGANADKVHASIELYGFRLNCVPISILKCPDKNEYIGNGKTRLEKLLKEGFTNVIVDYYECSNWDSFSQFGVMSNSISDPYSPHTMLDIVSHCQKAIANGLIENTYDAIFKRAKFVSNGSFGASKLNEISLRVMEEKNAPQKLFHYNEESGKEWLERMGYIDNDKNNGIYYRVYSTEYWSKSFFALSNFFRNLVVKEGKKVKELRVILHTGTLDGSNPVASWKSKIDRFRTHWDGCYDNIEYAFFEHPERSRKIKLYGALPAVASIANEYPMDRLVIFHIGKLKDKLFSDLDNENALNRFMDLD
jgi:hypothetical protein